MYEGIKIRSNVLEVTKGQWDKVAKFTAVRNKLTAS